MGIRGLLRVRVGPRLPVSDGGRRRVVRAGLVAVGAGRRLRLLRVSVSRRWRRLLRLSVQGRRRRRLLLAVARLRRRRLRRRLLERAGARRLRRSRRGRGRRGGHRRRRWRAGAGHRRSAPAGCGRRCGRPAGHGVVRLVTRLARRLVVWWLPTGRLTHQRIPPVFTARPVGPSTGPERCRERDVRGGSSAPATGERAFFLPPRTAGRTGPALPCSQGWTAP
jgi:hypothetical protein